MLVEKKFSQIIQKIFPEKFPKKIAVAVSGGVDSMALLVLLNKLFSKKTKIFCLTVDHNFRKNSASDAKFVANFCKENSISCAILKSPLKTKPAANIENSLREVRYNLLKEFCAQNQIEYLFLAHHQNDLAENFLIRLFRGSGIDGLAAMEYINGQLVRPFLDFTKDELQEYLQASKIKWVEDETNEDEKYLRNKIRQFLKSLPDSKSVNQRIALASRAILSAKKILHSDMQKNAGDILEFNQMGYFVLNVKNFKKLDEETALRYLSWALMDVSGNDYKPRLEQLQKVYDLILQNKINKAHTFYGCVLERLGDGRVIIYREFSSITPHAVIPAKAGIHIWDNRFVFNVMDPSLRWDDDGGSRDDVAVGSIDVEQLNQLIKTNPALKKLNLKNPLKKVLLTIPVLKIADEIIAIPHLNYYADRKLKNKISVKFQGKTPLTNAS